MLLHYQGHLLTQDEPGVNHSSRCSARHPASASKSPQHLHSCTCPHGVWSRSGQVYAADMLVLVLWWGWSAGWQGMLLPQTYYHV
jgi:hypothetical protein